MNSLLKSNPGNTLQENLYNSLQPIPDQQFTEHDGTQAVLKSPHLSVHSARPMNPTTVVTSSSSVGYQNQNNMNVSSVSGNVASIVPFSHPQKTIATKGAHYQAQMMKNIKAASNTHLQPYPQGSWVSYPSDPQYNGNSAAPVETLISQPTATTAGCPPPILLPQSSSSPVNTQAIQENVAVASSMPPTLLDQIPPNNMPPSMPGVNMTCYCPDCLNPPSIRPAILADSGNRERRDVEDEILLRSRELDSCWQEDAMDFTRVSQYI